VSPLRDGTHRLHNSNESAGGNQEVSGIMTVGQLRAVLAGIADDTPLIVNAADPQDPDIADSQVIAAAGFGRVDWGDGRGLVEDSLFGLDCRLASWSELNGMRERPERPRSLETGA
jgi:hypothetical protein